MQLGNNVEKLRGDRHILGIAPSVDGTAGPTLGFRNYVWARLGERRTTTTWNRFQEDSGS